MPSRLDLFLYGDASQLKGEVSSAEQAVREGMAAMASSAKEVVLGFAALGASGAGMARKMLDAEKPLEQIEARMLTVHHSASKMHAEVEKLQKMQADFKLFDLEALEKSSNTLKNITGDADKLLPLAATLAAQFGNLEGKAGTLAGAWEGNEKKMKAFNKECQITNKELVAAGAIVDQHSGKIKTQGVEALEAYRGAMVKVIQSKYGDALKNQNETLAGSMTALKNTIHENWAELGQQIAPTVAKVVRGIESVIHTFHALPETAKGLISWGALAAGVFGTLGVAVVGLFTTLGPAAVAWKTYTQLLEANKRAKEQSVAAAASLAGVEAALTESATAGAVAQGEMAATGTALAGAETAAATATTGLVVSLGAVLGVVGVLAVGFAGLIFYLEHSNKVQEEAIAVSEKQQAAYRKGRDAVIDLAKETKNYADVTEDSVRRVAQAMKDKGKTDADVHGAIVGLMDRRRQLEGLFAEARDNAAKALLHFDKAEFERQANIGKKIQDQIDLTDKQIDANQRLAREMTGTADAKLKADEASKKSDEARMHAANEAYEALKQNRQHHTFVNQQEELAAMDAVIAKMQSVASLDKAIQKELKDLQLDRIALVRHAREEALKLERDDIHLLVEQGKASKAEEAAAVLALASKYSDLADKKRAMTIEAATLTRKASEEQAAAEARVIEAHKSSLDARINGLEQQLKKGGDLKKQQAELTAAIKERAQAEEDLAKKKLEEEKIKDPSHAAELEKATAEKIKAIHTETATQLVKLQDEIRQHEVARMHASIAASEAASRASQSEIDRLKERLKNGESVNDQLLKEIQHRRELEQATLKQKRAEIQKATDDPEERKAKLKALADEEKASATRAEKDVAEVKREQVTREKKDAAEKASADERLAQARVESIKAEAALGQRLDDSYLQAVRARQAAQAESVRAKAEAAMAGKNEAEQQVIMRQAAQELLLLKKQHEEEELKIKDEIEAQTNALRAQADEMNGKVQSIQEAFSGPGAFSLDKPKNGSSRFVNNEKLDKQRRIDREYEQGLADLEKGKPPSDLGPTERREAEAARDAASAGKAVGGEVGLGAVVELLQVIAQKMDQPTKIEAKGSGMSTESLSWGLQTNKPWGSNH